jgi:hypothetical protein
MEWSTRAIEVDEGIAEAMEEGGFLTAGWEPFAIAPLLDGSHILFLKKEVMVEDDEKSSVQHELSFQERYER